MALMKPANLAAAGLGGGIRPCHKRNRDERQYGAYRRSRHGSSVIRPSRISAILAINERPLAR